MRDLVYITSTSVDGFIGAADGDSRWIVPDPELHRHFNELVAIDPRYRGRGYATAIMERVALEIADGELGGLSPASHRLYEGLGRRFWRGPLSARTGSGTLATPDDRVMVLPLPRTPPLDFQAPLSIEWRPGEVW